jgi:hypothetical protein
MSRRLAQNAAALTLAAALAFLGNAAAAQTASTNGTIIVTGTVNLVSGISQSAVSARVIVVMEAGVAGATNQYIISAPVTLTWTGNSGSGTVTLPYSWTYESDNTDYMRINFYVSANLASEPYAENGVTVAVPNSGSTTTEVLPASM